MTMAVRAHNFTSFNLLSKRKERKTTCRKRAHISPLPTEVIELEYRNVLLAAIHTGMRC